MKGRSGAIILDDQIEANKTIKYDGADGKS